MFTLITVTALMVFFFVVWSGVNRNFRDSGEAGIATISATVEVVFIALAIIAYVPTAQFILTL